MCEKYSTDVASEDDSGDNDCSWPCIRKNAGQEDGEALFPASLCVVPRLPSKTDD